MESGQVGIKLSQAMKKFLRAKEAANRAERTLEKYTGILSDFISHAGDVEIHTVTDEIIEDYLARKRRNGNRPASLETYFHVFNAFWKWCGRKYNLNNPMANLEKPQVPRRLPKFLRDSEVEMLFRALEKTRDHLKNHAILTTFLGTGIRLSELINLEKGHVDLQNNELRVFGKDQEERVIPIESEVAQSIATYWASRTDTSKWAFLSSSGQRYTPSGLRSLITRLGQFSEVSFHVHPHLLRHTFAHNWLVQDGQLDTLRIILGHTNLIMTQRYANTVIEDVKRAHQKVAPISRFIKDT